MKKIFVISVGRSDYDRYYPIIKELNNSPKVKLFLFLTKQHFDKTLGKTVNYIDKKFNLLKNQYYQKKYRNTKVEIINNFSDDLKFLSKKINKFKPNILIVLGDRIEMLIGPIAAIPNNIPVIHLYGGAVTEGSTDELIRHAITKMCHYHFVLLNQYKKRLIQLGEEKWRIKKIGMHELKYLKSLKPISKNELKKIFYYDFSEPYLLITFHPVTLELDNLGYQLKSLAKAIKKSKLNAVITYPNADLKHLEIIKFLEKNFNNKKKFKIIKNCGLKYYSSIMQYSEAMVGNSSSGIVEAASFNLPVINIGTRQDGKYKACNVVDTGYHYSKIYKAIKKVTKKNFKNKIKKIINPYESNISTKELLNFILKLKLNDRLLKKKFMDLS